MKLASPHFSISKFSLIAYGFFITSFFLMRILIPFGDEPDFEVRLKRLQFSEQISAFDIHRYVNFFPKISQDETCIYESGSSSIWAKISSECLELNLNVVPYKLFHVLFLTCPIFLLAIFREQAYRLFFDSLGESFLDWGRKLDASILGILIPSSVYAFSFISQEVFSYSLLFLLLIICRSYLLTSFLLFWILNLDFGAFLVLGMFLSCRMLLMALSKKIGIKLTILFAGVLVFWVFVIGGLFLEFLVQLNLQSKFSEIYDAIVSKEAYDKYPLFFRPIMAIMSLVFMSASGIKSIVLYIIFVLFLSYFMPRVIYCHTLKNNISLSSGCCKLLCEETEPAVIGFFSVIVTIFCIIFIAPTHVNAKYYIFMMPFVIHPFLYFFSRYSILHIVIFASVILYLNIGFYYMT